VTNPTSPITSPGRKRAIVVELEPLRGVTNAWAAAATQQKQTVAWITLATNQFAGRIAPRMHAGKNVIDGSIVEPGKKRHTRQRQMGSIWVLHIGWEKHCGTATAHVVVRAASQANFEYATKLIGDLTSAALQRTLPETKTSVTVSRVDVRRDSRWLGQTAFFLAQNVSQP